MIAGDLSSSNTQVLLQLVNRHFLPNKVVLLAIGGVDQKELARWLPFLSGVTRKAGRATAYVCENYVCKLPTADPETMERILDNKQ